MKRTAVVYGATGLVGKELVKELIGLNDYEKVITVARRNMPGLNPKHEQILLTDFANLAQQKDKLEATDFFCCIGTTIKIAGSHDAFRRVDFDIPVQIARLAQELAVANMVVISSIGAAASSSNFYLRTKGEMENAVRVTFGGNLKIVRPSLLVGDRDEYRFAERISVIFMKILGWIFTGPVKKYRAISANNVAKAMIKATGLPVDKVILESDELQALALEKVHMA